MKRYFFRTCEAAVAKAMTVYLEKTKKINIKTIKKEWESSGWRSYSQFEQQYKDSVFRGGVLMEAPYIGKYKNKYYYGEQMLGAEWNYEMFDTPTFGYNFQPKNKNEIWLKSKLFAYELERSRGPFSSAISEVNGFVDTTPKNYSLDISITEGGKVEIKIKNKKYKEFITSYNFCFVTPTGVEVVDTQKCTFEGAHEKLKELKKTTGNKKMYLMPQK